MEFTSSKSTDLKHAIILGCSLIGSLTASSLVDLGYKVSIIDPDVATFTKLPKIKVDQGHIIPIIGNPDTLHEDFLKASIQDSEVVMALSDSDTTNALSGQFAKHLFHVEKVICLIENPALNEMYEKLGLSTINTTTLATQMLEQEIGN